MRIKVVIVGTLASAVLMVLEGCATSDQIQQYGTSRVLPCPAADIMVSNNKTQGLSGIFTWDATCNGKTYHCSGRTTGNADIQDVSCKE